MNKIASKDKIFVGIQLLLFVIYFIPVFDLAIKPNAVLKMVSLIIGIAGLIIILVAILQLNKNLTPFPTPVNNGILIKTGLYKFVRHPIYSGIIIAALGFGFFYESLWKTGTGLLLLILFFFKSRYEEILLQTRYPDYKDYKKQSGRFFPFI